MDPQRFKRIKALVQQALDLRDEERSTFLDREYAGDPELRAEVERLLAQTPESDLTHLGEEIREVVRPQPHDTTVEGPVESSRPDEGETLLSTPSAAGGRIGPYRLLEKIGEGGMGEVWVADQTEPVRRRVALKLIKRGMDSARSSPASRPSARLWR